MKKSQRSVPAKRITFHPTRERRRGFRPDGAPSPGFRMGDFLLDPFAGIGIERRLRPGVLVEERGHGGFS